MGIKNLSIFILSGEVIHENDPGSQCSKGKGNTKEKR